MSPISYSLLLSMVAVLGGQHSVELFQLLVHVVESLELVVRHACLFFLGRMQLLLELLVFVGLGAVPGGDRVSELLPAILH